MNSVASDLQLDRIIDERVIAKRATPLDQLAADADVPGLVARILDNALDTDRVQVARFNSAI